MARQRLGPKAVQRMARKTGLAIDYVLVRGNTGHRYDVYLVDGRTVSLWRDGKGGYTDQENRPTL